MPGHRGWALAALGVAAGIAWGSLTPADELPAHLPWDKFNHLAAYAALSGALGLAGWRLAVAAGVAVVYGVVIELAQLGVPGRAGGDPLDILANTLGALLAGGLLLAWRRRRTAA
ncbi:MULTISPECIES: VanZ family protein [unclassified Modicisalibacter]|uniref:VanZ family protein n=1 Tax=unclassified Modicisalibacter TaxID=2679913 RepID=UPI001CCE1E10|nr:MULTISPECIES: VanZ family protein [unclassified Modicisalibacter]MBZ9558433.1 VanZ family protein [Modicisalibacter sp. R2A 31.J]MBZ9575675.1 VanZ family protein [Modicisalibacter sp. MOD 31.J]